MKLKSLNKLDPKYGFPDTVWFDDENYHGHQRGIALCIKEEDTGEIYRNYIKPLDGNADADELAKELINDKNIKLLVDEETYFNEGEGKLSKRILYQLPYANIDSSAFKTTVNFDGADDDPDHNHKMTIEVLFVINGLNRYIEIVTETTDEGPVQAAINYLKNPDNLVDIGFERVEDDDEIEDGWYLEVYNEANKEGSAFMGATPEDILLYINSIRLIGIETFAAKGESDETKPEEVTVYAE